MNRVAVSAEETPLPPWTDALKDYILKLLALLGRDRWNISVLLCNNGYIQGLNARFRSRDEPTDVLSFSLGESVSEADGETWYLPGDIVISLETLAENARYYKVSEDEELRRLLIHGVLHLDGMDHDTNEESQPMLRLQEQLLAQLAGARILSRQAAGVE
ncbi:MAG: rRNA maturation RNase YbeY [Treponema sp.]|nr:rRNA maturation RNase YbeY [Treponema sp.]